MHLWVWSTVFDKTEQMERESDLWLLYRQKDKRCAERYTIFQPRIKSLWTLTIIWNKYNVDFMVNYGTLWCSRIWNMRPESPRTVFNFKLTLFNWMYKSNWLLKYPHNGKQHWNKSVRYFCQSNVHESSVTTATAEFSFRIILGRLILK